jgi:ferric-dicitrate binding protein FerR (iron transport regulator)
VLELKLADGTTVKLNKGSELKVAGMEKEATGSREVWLRGEAFFDVSHLANNRGFVVHSGDVNVAVLGTRFNVRTTLSRTAVALESGKVELSINAAHSQKLVMKPGELVEYSTSSHTPVKTKINVHNYSAWQSGKVILENAGLSEIQKVLEERYGLKTEAEQGSELGEFNGVFPADDPAVLIQALEKAYPSQVVRFENGLRFRKAENN